MKKIDEAKEILRDLGLPPAQQNDIAALTLLSLCGIGKRTPWGKATRSSLTVTKGIMEFIRSNYGKKYAPNTRETFRRQVLHYFMDTGIVEYNPDNPGLATTSPRAHYAVTEFVVRAIRSFGTDRWGGNVKKFIAKRKRLIKKSRRKRARKKVSVKIPGGKKLTLSPGEHNELQAAIVEEFAPRFIPGALLLYLGDTAKKDLYLNEGELKSLNIPVTDHSKLPDIIFLAGKRNCLVLVEAVTSHGPKNPKRVNELEKFLSKSGPKRVYITAFLDFKDYRKHLKAIAWETEVWIAEVPDHLIHYNGEKFFLPG